RFAVSPPKRPTRRASQLDREGVRQSRGAARAGVHRGGSRTAAGEAAPRSRRHARADLESRVGERLMKRDREVFEPIEAASQDELRALQLARLRWTLRHAYENVPHYQRKFDAAGVRPEDLRTLEDLRHFPFTTKADLRECYPFGMFTVKREQVVRVHAATSTTAKPTVVG